MPENLLKNSSFEDGWSDITGSIQEPNEWTFEWYDGVKTVEIPEEPGEFYYTETPELNHKDQSVLPPDEWEDYILDGDWCCKIFAGGSAFHARLYQEVAGLEIGAVYRLEVPTFTDTYQYYNNQKNPPEYNDGNWEHAARLALEINFSEDVVYTWFDESNVENFYLRKHNFCLEFTATETEAEVGVEMYHPWPIDNNGWFFDDLKLYKIKDSEAYLCPREPYEKTVFLLPQEASYDLRQAAAIAGADRKISVIQSADDSLIGPADRTVYVVNPETWGGFDAVTEFADIYYPGAELIEVTSETPWEAGIKLLPDLDSDIAQGQSWEKWGDIMFGEDADTPIKVAGCFLVGSSITLRKVYQKEITPEILDNLLVAARTIYYMDNLLNWEKFVEAFPLFTDSIKDNKVYTAEELNRLLSEGWEIILRRSDGGHFVYLENVSNGLLHIIDTYDGKRHVRGPGEYAGIRAARVGDGQEPPPPPTPEEPQYDPVSHVLGMQQQRGGEYRDQYIARAKPPFWKLIGGMGEAYHLKSLYPDIKIIYRHCHNDWKPFITAEDKDKAARDFIDMFRDSLLNNASVIDGIEGFNEYIACNDYETLEHVSGWVEAFCAELERMGYPARPVTLNIAVGNPQTDEICEEQGIPSQFAYLERALRATAQAGGWGAYHAYYGARQIDPGTYYCTLGTEDSKYYESRWMLIDKHMRELDDPVYVKWLLTEGGPIYVAPYGGMPFADAGWKWPNTFGGDYLFKMDQAIKTMQQFNNIVQLWNSNHGNRCRSLLTFIHGGYGDWLNFDWEGEPSRRLADSIELLG